MTKVIVYELSESKQKLTNGVYPKRSSSLFDKAKTRFLSLSFKKQKCISVGNIYESFALGKVDPYLMKYKVLPAVDDPIGC